MWCKTKAKVNSLSYLLCDIQWGLQAWNTRILLAIEHTYKNNLLGVVIMFGLGEGGHHLCGFRWSNLNDNLPLDVRNSFKSLAKTKLQ